MRNVLRYCLLIFMTCNPPPCRASEQENTADISDHTRRQVDELVENDIKNLKGYALAVIKNGTVVIKKGYGFANLEEKIPVTPKTIFGLASLTKAFTAICILALAEQGKISLDDTIDKYLLNLPSQYQKLSVRQLATMTGGVPSSVEPEVEWDKQLSMLTTQPLEFKPGSSFRYSNFSYRLLGSIIESVTRKSYMNTVEDIILKPNEMLNTGTLASHYGSGIFVAQGYDTKGRVPYKKPEISFASGMLASNLDDMIKYVQALLARKIVSKPKSYAVMWYDRTLIAGKRQPWAFGWSAETGDFFGKTYVVDWFGTNVGVTSTLIILPEKDSAIIALCNSQSNSARTLSQKIAHLVFSGR